MRNIEQQFNSSLKEIDGLDKRIDQFDPKNPESEYHVDIESEDIQEKIQKAKELYDNFYEEFKEKLDFENPQSISEAYDKAKESGIFDKAKEIRELIFGKDMHFYGVAYLWDKCLEHCAYCPGSKPNRKKAKQEGANYPLRKLTLDKAVEDTKAVMKDGHTHLCYLTGSFPGPDEYPDTIIPYLKKIIAQTKDEGLEEIILNIEPQTDEGFKKIVDAVKEINDKNGTNIALQFRVFQETYNRDTYAKVHPKGGKMTKADYDFRRFSQQRAFNAGFDTVGCGALFGLHRNPLEEVAGLKQHVEELLQQGAKVSRVCLPSANELESRVVDIPYKLTPGQTRPKKKGEKLGPFKYGDYEKSNELIYALARLSMPQINIVSSERDTPEMLEKLNKYATCTTLNVHPGVGDNAEIFPQKKNKDETHFEQASVFPRNSESTLNELKKQGYNPIIKEIKK